MQESLVKLDDMELVDYPSKIVLTYRVGKADFDMIYQKEKDSVRLYREGEPASLERMTEEEIASYKEALEICIVYHHNRETADLH